MISKQLMNLAGKYGWNSQQDDDGDTFVFGEFNGFLFTAMDGKGFKAFFTPVAGISPESLSMLKGWLNDNIKTFNLRNFEMTDNFLCLRLQEEWLPRSISKLESFLIKLTGKLDELGLPEQACAICGKAAPKKGLYVGLFCHLHPECQSREGYDFTSDSADSQASDHNETPSDAKIIELADSMRSYQSNIINDLTALCSIPSVLGEARSDAPFGQDTATALEAFLEMASELGFETKNIDNMAGYAQWGENGEITAALCHLDVVPAGDGWTVDPFCAGEKGDRIYGRGTADDKGPAISVLYAMKALKDEGFVPAGRIRLIVGLDEENGSRCMERYVKTEEMPASGFTADASFPVIHAEKGITWVKLNISCSQSEQDELKLLSASGGNTANMVPGACKLLFDDGKEITVEGRQAHASRPEDGTNAISLAMAKAAELLSQKNSSHPFVDAYLDMIGSFTDGSKASLDFSDEYGNLTMNAGILRLDQDSASLTLDIRYPVTTSFEKLKSELESKAEEYGFSCEWGKHSPPLFIEKDSALVQTLSQVYNVMTDTTTSPVAIGGGTYARAVSNIVAFGPSFPGDPDVCHQADEYLVTDKLLAMTAIYKEALRALSRNQV